MTAAISALITLFPFFSSASVAQSDQPTTGSLQISLSGSDGAALFGSFSVTAADGSQQSVVVESGYGLVDSLAAGLAEIRQTDTTLGYSFDPAYVAATSITDGAPAMVSFVNPVLVVDTPSVEPPPPTEAPTIELPPPTEAPTLEPTPTMQATAGTPEPTVDPTTAETQSSTALPTFDPTPTMDSMNIGTTSETATPEAVVGANTAVCDTTSGATPWIATDASDYSPGALVTLTGGGWNPGETIHIVIDDDGLADPIQDPWIIETTVIADAQGQFVYQFNIATWYVADYTVVAVGDCYTATTTFTDTLTITSVLINGQTSVSVLPGATLSIAVTLNTDGTNWHTTGWRIATTPPGTFTCTNTRDFNAVGTATRTFTVPAPTTPGIYDAYFVAYQGGSCDTNRLLSATYVMLGSVVVVTTTEPTSLTVAPASGVYGGSVNLSATLVRTSNGAAVSGKTISFYLDQIAVGTATTNASGVATLANASLAGIAAGSYLGGIEADFSGDSSFSASLAYNDLTVAVRPVTVTADGQMKTYGTADPALTYTITSGSLATGDAFTGSLTRVAGESLGSYPILQGTLALNANYALTYVGANFIITTASFTLSCTPISSTVDVPGTQSITCTLTAVNLGSAQSVGVSIPAIATPIGWTAAAATPSSGTVTQATPFQFTVPLTSSCTALTTAQTVPITSILTYGTQPVNGPSTSVTVARSSNASVNVAITSANLSWTREYSLAGYPTNPGSMTYQVQATGCAGWSISVVASNFVYSGPGSGGILPTSNLTLTGSTLPAGSGLSTPVTTGTLDASLTVLVADPNSGAGITNHTLDVNLSIPPGAQVGTYQSTMTITAASGP